MGWRERDYARFNEAERRVFYGEGPAEPSMRRSAGASRRAATRSTGLAVIVSLALLLAGRHVSGSPVGRALRFAEPSAPPTGSPSPSPPRSLLLDVPSTAALGSGVDIDGTLHGYNGRVVLLEGSLDGASWTTLAAGRLDADGHFRVSVRYTGRGVERLRLSYPNGDAAVATVVVG